MVDQKSLMLQPVGPAIGTDLLLDALSQVGAKRRPRQLGLVRPTTSTVDGFHGGFGPPIDTGFGAPDRDETSTTHGGGQDPTWWGPTGESPI